LFTSADLHLRQQAVWKARRKQMKRIGQLAIVCAAVFTLACNNNGRFEKRDTNENRNTVGTTGVSNADKDWVEEGLDAGMAEIELGRLAEQRATNPEVKQYAQMMVRDHTKAGDDLKQLAQKYSITVSPHLEDKYRALMDRLSKLNGAEFDREYIDAMVDGHEDIINHLQSKASEDRFGENKGTVRPERADNPVEASLNQWAANTLPVARQHLDDAKRIKDSLGKTGRNTTSNRTTNHQPASSKTNEPAKRY
jgi:putative membrane protein